MCALSAATARKRPKKSATFFVVEIGECGGLNGGRIICLCIGYVVVVVFCCMIYVKRECMKWTLRTNKFVDFFITANTEQTILPYGNVYTIFACALLFFHVSLSIAS